MKKEICVFSESYTTEELWFDDETNLFSIKQYHWGVIDDEEHYDGENVTDIFNALKKMISYNKLHEVLQYDNELQVEQNLDVVLSNLTQSSWIYNYDYLADGHFKYYKISEKEYAIYYEKTFFTVTDQGKGIADFTVVRRILENKETVTYSEYDYFKNTWVHSSLISFEQVQKLADKSEDERAFKYKCAQPQEDLNDARYQAQQMFQRGGLDREQAYAAYGLDSDGNELK